MKFSENVKALRNIPMFSRLDTSKLKRLAFASEYLAFDNGEVLFHQGDHADCAYLIKNGEVIISSSHNEDEVNISTLGTHDLFGEMALFRSSVRIVTAKAKGSLKVMRIDGDMFIKMVSENQDTALAVMQVLSDKIAKAVDDYDKLDKKYLLLKKDGERS